MTAATQRGVPKLVTVLTWISKDLVSDLLMMTAVIFVTKQYTVLL